MTGIQACPICRATAANEVQRQNLRLAGLGQIEIGFGYCEACGHIYQVRPAPAHVLDRHYAAFSNYTCFDVEAARKAPPSPLTKRLLALAEVHAPKRGLAYEVGCATGPHLAHFRNAGWTVAGCDPSAKACAQALTVHGTEVDCTDEAEALPARSSLDLVLFSHVLEHVTDPRSALLRARESLSEEGVVLLEVPCAIAPHLLPPGWLTFEHLHYFSEGALLRLLESVGLAPLELRVAFEAYIYPVIAIVARKAQDQRSAHDRLAVRQTEKFLGDLVSRDAAFWSKSASRLEHLKGAVYVWGAGVHTAQLLDRTPLLKHAQVKAIVDRDSQKWGLEQAGCTIISPDGLFAACGDEPIVISSFAAEAEIAGALSNAGIAQDRIVRLYS